jgi:hypothetical protein
METFEVGVRCCYTQHPFRMGEEGMKCLSCNLVMKIDVWNTRQQCFCGSRNAVRARAGNSPPISFRDIPRSTCPPIEQPPRSYNPVATNLPINPSNIRTPSINTNNPIDRLPNWLVSLFKFCVYIFSTVISAIFYPPIFHSITDILSGFLSPAETLNNKVEWSFTDLLLYLLQFPVAFIWAFLGLAMFIVVCVLVSQSILAFSSWVFNGNTLRSGNRSVWYVGLFATIIAILLGLTWYTSSSKKISPPQETNITPSSTRTVSGSWSFPMPECGSDNPPGEQNFYPVFINKTDDSILRYIKRNYCNDAYIQSRESVERKSIQVASFRSKSQAQDLAQIMLDDPNINSGEVGAPTLR